MITQVEIIRCPNCQTELFEKGEGYIKVLPDEFIEVIYGNIYDFSGKPWQIKCPECKRVSTMWFVPKEEKNG